MARRKKEMYETVIILIDGTKSFDNQMLFNAACVLGETRVVEDLISRVNPADSHNFPIKTALLYGHLNVTKLLLNDSRVDPTFMNHRAVRVAAEQGYIDIIKLLLQHPQINPFAEESQAVVIAIKKNHPEIVRLLLHHPGFKHIGKERDDIIRLATILYSADIVRIIVEFNAEIKSGALDSTPINLATSNNLPLRSACMYNAEEIVHLLLTDPQVNPGAENSECLRWATRNGNLALTELFLRYPDVDPTADSSVSIRNAVVSGNLRLVEVLLKDGRADPAAFRSESVRLALSNDYPEIALLLLKSGRVDYAAADNVPIRVAAARGYADIVEFLLRESNQQGNKIVDAACSNNEPLRMAVIGDHLEVVQVFLSDEFKHRVDPGTHQNELLRYTVHHKRYEFAYELLKDPRVHPSVNNNELLYLAVAQRNNALFDRILRHPNTDPPADLFHQFVQIGKLSFAAKFFDNHLFMHSIAMPQLLNYVASLKGEFLRDALLSRISAESTLQNRFCPIICASKNTQKTHVIISFYEQSPLYQHHLWSTCSKRRGCSPGAWSL